MKRKSVPSLLTQLVVILSVLFYAGIIVRAETNTNSH